MQTLAQILGGVPLRFPTIAVLIFGRQRSPGFEVVVLGILCVLFAGLFGMTNSLRRAQTSDWKNENPLDSGYLSNLKERFYVGSRSKALPYLTITTLSLGVILVLVGLIMEVA